MIYFGWIECQGVKWLAPFGGGKRLPQN